MPFFVFSYYLYMCDKVVAPNVSLTSAVSQSKEVTKTEANRSLPRQSEKPHSGGKHQKTVSYPDVSLEEQEKMDLKTSRELCSRLGKYSELIFLKIKYLINTYSAFSKRISIKRTFQVIEALIVKNATFQYSDYLEPQLLYFSRMVIVTEANEIDV